MLMPAWALSATAAAARSGEWPPCNYKQPARHAENTVAHRPHSQLIESSSQCTSLQLPTAALLLPSPAAPPSSARSPGTSAALPTPATRPTTPRSASVSCLLQALATHSPLRMRQMIACDVMIEHWPGTCPHSFSKLPPLPPAPRPHAPAAAYKAGVPCFCTACNPGYMLSAGACLPW